MSVIVVASDQTRSSITDGNGDFSVSLEHGGLLSFSVFGMEIAPMRRVDLTEDLHGVELQIVTAATIGGLAVRDERPVAGADVFIRQVGRDIRTVSTDSNGRFQIGGLPAGTYEIVSVGDTPTARSAQLDLSIALGERREDIVIHLDRGGSIEGVVQDEKGIGVSGATVRFGTTTGDGGSAVTDAGGRYRVLYLAGAAAYEAKVYPEETSAVPYPFAQAPAPVTLKDGRAAVTDVTLVLRAALRPITGRVVDELGAPIANAALRIWPSAGGEPLASLTSDRNGFFASSPMPSSSYDVHVEVDDHETIAQHVDWERGPVTLTIPACAPVYGTTIGFTENPRIEVIEGNGLVPKADLHGSTFDIPSASRGKIMVVASNGGQIDAQVVEVSPPVAAQVTLRPRPLVELDGWVRDKAGNGLGNVPCKASVWLPGFYASEAVLDVPVDRDGSFAFQAPVGLGLILHCSGSRAIGTASIKYVADGGNSPLSIVINDPPFK